jgi:glycosyltransferase involved in cell wall biosynthesis
MRPTASKKETILFVNGHLNVGGVEKSLADLLCAIDYSKYDVDLLLLEAKGVYLEQIPHEVNVIFHDPTYVYGPAFKTVLGNLLHARFSDCLYRLILLLTPFIGERMYRFFQPLLKIRNRYDCAIAYRVGEPNKIVSLSVNARKKICWWHNGHCDYTPQEIRKIDRLWKNIDFLVSVSEGCKQMLQEKFKFDRAIYVIPNTINVKAIAQMAGDVNPYPNDRDKIIVTLGRLCQEKHMVDIPLIAQKLLAQGHKDFKWYIIGDGAKKEEIIASINEKNLSEFVVVLGWKTNPYPYLKFANVLMHTSYVEAHCLTLLEAMALKTPCVATKTMIPQDFIIDGVTCLLAEQDTDHQYECLRIMLYGDIDIAKMTDHAFQMVKQSYNSSVTISKIDNLLLS